jgi:hypothetical protein
MYVSLSRGTGREITVASVNRDGDANARES